MFWFVGIVLMRLIGGTPVWGGGGGADLWTGNREREYHLKCK